LIAAAEEKRKNGARRKNKPPSWRQQQSKLPKNAIIEELMSKKAINVQTVESYLDKIKLFEHSKNILKALSLCEKAKLLFPENSEIVSKLARLRGKLIDELPPYYTIQIADPNRHKMVWDIVEDGSLKKSLNGNDIYYNPITGSLKIEVTDYHSGPIFLHISDFKY